MLFDVPVNAVTMDQTIDAVRAMVEEGSPHQHVVVNAAKIVELHRNPALRDIVAGCDLVNADGMSVVWAARLLGKRLPERVTGIDLFVRLVETAALDGRSVYFLGARSDVVAEVAQHFEERFPDLRVAGYRDGFWKDDAEVIEAVRAARPDYLFLAIPSPRKEFWLHDHLAALGVPFVMGVGGSFDVITGRVARAAPWAQRAGLEWLWRVAQEPRRMWKRYLVGNSRFIALTAQEWWTRT
jgi:N-acetylglucosaminyldiphosphoundecaprenol N-acetyl-beta-D-mannosaminyltransferase